MTAAGSIRIDVLDELCTQLRVALGDDTVKVCEGWPGTNMAREQIWVHDIDGEEDYPTAEAGRKRRDDQFVITFRLKSQRNGAASRLDPMRQVEAYLDALTTVIVADATLGDAVDGLIAIVTGKKKGPYSTPMDQAGFEGRAELEVQCWTVID